MNRKIEVVQLVADSYPPYQYMDGDAVRGVDHDIIVAAFREHGVDTITRLLPWGRCIQLLKEGKAHGIFQIVRTPEREKEYIFSKPLRAAKTVFYRRKEDPITLRRDTGVWEQLRRFRVGVVKGYSYESPIDRLGEPFRVEMDSQTALLAGLTGGDFDLAIIDRGVAEYLANKMGIDGIDTVEGYEMTRQLHVAFQRSRNEIADRFDSGLDRVKEKGIYDRIFEYYGLTQNRNINRGIHRS